VLGISGDESDRHGGPAHRYWCKLLADHLAKHGYDVTKEAPLGDGKAVDILAVKDGKRIAFEVETGKSDAAANVRKCLAAQLDKVVIVATTKNARRAIAAAMDIPDGCILATGPQVLRRLESLSGRGG